MPEDSAPTNEANSRLLRQNTHLGVAFPATQWSMVLRTRHEGQESQRAMNDLCRRYWYPIYAYLRGRGFDRVDAQDITQGFFFKAVTGSLIQNAEEGRGRLRSFLLGALNRHLADHLRHERAEKRGGRAIVLPLECQDAEERYTHEPVDYRDPEKLYLAAWARSMLDRVRNKVREHYVKSGRETMFDELLPFLSIDDAGATYSDVAEKLQASEAALRLQVFRIRQRFSKLLREEVALTVETPEELEEEMSWFSEALRAG